MYIASLALGGCIRSEPVSYGITEDTGGHIRYILGEMTALSLRDDVTKAEIITRLFDDRALGAIHNCPEEHVNEKLTIRRIDSGDRRYLAKEDLYADRDAFTRSLIVDLLMRGRRPDVIHAHFADAAAVAAEVEKALGIPFIYTPHSLGRDKLATLEEQAPASLLARIDEEQRAICGARLVVGSSRDECERQLTAYSGASSDKIRRIRPGVEKTEISQADRDAAYTLIEPFLRDPSKPLVLAIARPVRKKNIAGVIKAFAMSPSLSDRANLVVLAGQRHDLDRGEPEQVEIVRDMVGCIDRYGLYGKVAYPKTHDRNIVSALYTIAAESGGIFVNPAFVEPYGLTVVEAAAAGLPVVATQVGGPYDIVGELKHGLLVDPHDIPAIGGAMLRLIVDRDLHAACAKAGRLGARSHSWERYADELMSVLRTITRPKPRRIAPNVPIRHLLVSDIDNTLTGCTKSARRFTRFLERRSEYGFAVATGRSIAEAQRLIREWQLPTPLAWITSVGTEIYMTRDEALSRDEEFSDLIEADWDGEAVVAAIQDIRGLTSQAPYEQRDFKRSYFMESYQVAAEVELRLADAGINARVIVSHGNLLDVVPRLAGKGAAMRHLARKLGIPRQNVYAAGDSGNDSDMLIACHNPILVGNHASEVAHLRNETRMYVSRRHHAAGTLEGLIMQTRRRRGQSGKSPATIFKAGVRA